MANMRELRMRVKSLESTQQMTKSMKMVAASKLRRTQVSYGTMKSFAEGCSEVLKDIMSGSAGEENPFMQVRPDRKRVCYVLFVGNRGLCGAYNQSVLRFLADALKQENRECFLVVCGRWGREAILKTGVPVERWFDQMSDTPDHTAAQELSGYLKELYLSRKADEIHLVYQRYVSALVQNPGMEQFLPATVPQGMESGSREYLFEPDQSSVVARFVELYLDHTVYFAMLEAKSSEHSARMTAMTSASDNADELIAALRLEMNHVRQAAITTEIAEISGGSAMFEKE